jgi:hypothetical protein
MGRQYKKWVGDNDCPFHNLCANFIHLVSIQLQTRKSSLETTLQRTIAKREEEINEQLALVRIESRGNAAASAELELSSTNASITDAGKTVGVLLLIHSFIYSLTIFFLSCF